MRKFSYFFLSCLIMSFFACGTIPEVLSVKEPKVSLKSVDITGINLSGVSMLLHVDVENPNGITIPLPKIDWELFVNEASFIKGAINNDKSLTSHETVTLDFPVTIGYEGLYNTFTSIVNASDAAYDIAIAITFNIPVLGEKVYHLKHSGVLPMVKKPAISFQGIARKSLGTTMEFVLTWEVENRNNFDFNLAEFGYDFSVNNSRWARGQVAKPPIIKAGAKTAIPLTVSISALSIVTELVTIINRGTAVTYSCTGNMQFQGMLPGLEKFDLPLDLRGSTSIR